MSSKDLETINNTSKVPRSTISIKDALSEEDSKKISRGYEALGNIAIIESELPSKKEKLVATRLMIINPRIKTVLAKAGPIAGKYRIRKLRYVAGEKNYVAVYKEHNTIFEFDVRKVFFSAKLSYERARITELSKNNENIIVMFAGVGPFAIQIAKHNPNSKVVGIELNRSAYSYMKKNILLNKVKNVMAELGNVKKISKKYAEFADRIIMPLPKESSDYLDEVVYVAKNDAYVHIYAFGDIKSGVIDMKDKIRQHAKRKGYKVRFIFDRIVRNYSANQIEMVIDYKMTKK